MSTAPQGGKVPAFTVGDRLRKARETAGLEQGELADAMGVSRKTISNNEAGKVTPRQIVLRAWAMATGVSLRWIETGETPAGPEPGRGLDLRARRYSKPQPSDPNVRGFAQRTTRAALATNGNAA